MQIRPEHRALYPPHWPDNSRLARFEIPGPYGAGRCWKCGRPHGQKVKVVAAQRWFDPKIGT